MWSANQPDFFPRRARASRFPSARRSLVAAGTGLVAMTWIHALIALAGLVVALSVGGDTASGGVAVTGVAAWQITLAALVVGAVAGLSRSFLGGLAGSALVLGVLSLVGLDSLPATVAFLLLGPVLGISARRCRQALPMAFGDVSIRRPWTRVGVAALVLLSLVQVGRLSTYMADPSSDWFLTTRDPLWAKHACLSAYLHAAELNQRGETNVYDAAHYPGLTRDAAPETDMRGMAVEDPFQYPPQFLLLPTLARALSRDYLTLQVAWYALQTTLFLVVALALALWAGGRQGRLAALLLPLALTSFPVLHALQYGQFHLAAVVLALAAMLAFEARRAALGGAMLAVAISAKLFPALLLVLLAVRRKWRALAWTAGFGAGFAALGLVVLGAAPYAAFFDYHLPRLLGGQAFDFGAAWPEIGALLVADNQGAHGIVLKLQAMGVGSLDLDAARWATRLFVLGAVWLTALFARREAETSRHLRVAGWLAVLGLGAMTSPGAFGDYVPLTATWLLTFVAGSYARGWRFALPLSACWLCHYTLLGTAPIGGWVDLGVMMPLSLVAALLMLGLYAAVLGGTFAGETVRERAVADESSIAGTATASLPQAARSTLASWLALPLVAIGSGLVGSALGLTVLGLTLASPAAAQAGPSVEIVTVGFDETCDFGDLADAVLALESSSAEERIVQVQRGLYENVGVFAIIDRLTVRGGFETCASTQPTPNAKAILQGDENGSVLELVPKTPSVTARYRLENLSLERSEAITGGGLDLEGPADVTLESVLILGNVAARGGGVFVDASDGPVSLTLGANTGINGNRTRTSSFFGSDGAGIHCLGEGTIVGGAGAAVLGNVTADPGMGGGVYLDGCELIAESGFRVELNRAHRGGGIALAGRSQAVLDGAVVRLNRAEERDGESGRGGGVYVASGELHARRARIADNAAEPETGAAGGVGGGVYAERDGFGLLETQEACDGCLQLAANRAAQGAAAGVGPGGSLALRRVHVVGNVGDSALHTDRGGGPDRSVLQVRHSFLAGNVASNLVRLEGLYSMSLEHSSIGGNLLAEEVIRADHSGIETLASEVFLRSSAIHQPGVPATRVDLTVFRFADCLLVHDAQGLDFGTRVIEGDPEFADPSSGDLHLSSTSPAVDLCQPYLKQARDIDFESLPIDQVVVVDAGTAADAGADELAFIALPPPPETPLFADGFESADTTAWSSIAGK